MSNNIKEKIIAFNINLVKQIKITRITFINKNMLEQLLRSSTSIGANYFEADNASSRKDFVHKMNLCKKESAESVYWLTLLQQVELPTNSEFSNLLSECKEINLICNAIVKNTIQNEINLNQIA